MGENTTYTVGDSIWIHASREENNTVRTAQPIIAGNFFTRTLSGNGAYLISGHTARFTIPATKGVASSSRGIVAMGEAGRIYIPQAASQETGALSDFFQHGVFTVSFACDILSANSFKEIKDDDYTRNGYNNQGVTIAGSNNSISFRGSNFGVTLAGFGNVLDIPANMGVIICGAVEKDSSIYLDENFIRDASKTPKNQKKHWDTKTGPGIYMRGCVYDSEKNTISEGSLFSFSNSNIWKTKLRGYVQLEDNCNIYDKNGQQIVKDGALVK